MTDIDYREAARNAALAALQRAERVARRGINTAESWQSEGTWTGIIDASSIELIVPGLSVQVRILVELRERVEGS